jgi:transposase InsO family protein
VLHRDGRAFNCKEVQRLWREDGLRVPRRRRKRRRIGESSTAADRLAAQRPDYVCGIDYQSDESIGGRILDVLDTCSTPAS